MAARWRILSYLETRNRLLDWKRICRCLGDFKYCPILVMCEDSAGKRHREDIALSHPRKNRAASRYTLRRLKVGSQFWGCEFGWLVSKQQGEME